MERPKTKSKKISWFSIASVFLLAIALAVGVTTNVHAATGSFDRDGYMPDLGSNDSERVWITVTDSTGNTTNSRDDITVTIKNATQNVFTTFKLLETAATSTVFTTTGATQPVTLAVGTTSGYVEDFNNGNHNYPGLGPDVLVVLDLLELSANTGGDATTGDDGQLSVVSGDTMQLLYGGTTLDTAVVNTNSGSFSFLPSSVTPITTNTLAFVNLIISITDPDENLNPVLRDVIGFADRSALLSGNPGTGSSRVQIEAIDQTTGDRLSVGGTEVVARNIMLVETGNSTGIFTASGKVFGSTTATVHGNVLVGSSSTNYYTGQNITLGNLTVGPGVTFKIIEASASGRLALYEAGTTTTGPVQPVLGFVSPSTGSFVGTSSLIIGSTTANNMVVAMGTTTCLFGVPSNSANQGTNSSGLLKLIEGNEYCVVAISQFRGTTTGRTIGSAYTIGNGGSVTVTRDSFQLSGPRSGDTLKVSYLDELRSTGTSGTVTGSLAYGVSGVTGTLDRDSDAPDINDLVTITVVDGNLNTSSSSSESVASGSSLWGGTTTNRRGDHLTVSGYTQGSKTISLQHVDSFQIGTQTIRISNTNNSLVWMVPTSAGVFANPLTAGSINIAMGTQSVSAVPLVRGDSTVANSFLGSASTDSFVATLSGLDNTVEISPDGTHWISIPIEEAGANTSTFVGTVGFDYTALRLTTNTTTSVTTLISDFTGTTTIKFASPVSGAGEVRAVIGTGSVVRIFDGTTEEFTEVCSAAITTLSVKKLVNSTAYDPDKTYVQVIGNDMMTQRLDTTSDGTVLSRIGAICGGTYRIRYNDAIGASNAYLGGDTLAITTSNVGFTNFTASLSTDITGSTGPNVFITVTLVDQDLNTSTGSKQSTFEPNLTTSGVAPITANNENGVGLPSGSSTGNISRGFKNGATGKIVYASKLGSVPSASVDQSDNTIDLQLVETFVNSGTFKGSFQLSSSIATTNATSTSGGVLKVSNGDSITVFYNDSPSATACDNSLVYMSANPILIVAPTPTATPTNTPSPIPTPSPSPTPTPTATATATPTPTPTPIPTPSPVLGLQACYTFDEGSGTIAGDSSGNGNDGTIFNGAVWTTGINGGGLNFDGVNDYVSIPVMNNDEITVCAWFRKDINDTTRHDAIFSGFRNNSNLQLREGFELRFPSSASNTLEFVLVTQDGSGTRITRTARRNLINSEGNWYHAVGTYNITTGAQMLYVNGELVNTQTHLAGNTVVPLTFYSDMRIGHSRVNAGYFDGIVDDVSLYNRALTDLEVRALYNTFVYELGAHYALDEGTGTIANDSSGNGNHGSINGGATWTTGQSGGGLSFDGVNDYVTIPRINNDDISISAWFYKNANDTTRNDAILGGFRNNSNVQLREGYELRFPSSNPNTLQFVLVTQDGSGVKTLRTAQWNLGDSVFSWYHAVGTYNKTTGEQKLYVNGELVNTQTHLAGNTIVPLTFYSDMRIGTSRVNTGYFNGILDDVRLYRRVLSDQEVLDIYNGL